MPGYNAAFMSSLNDHKAWEGNIKDMIAMSIRESGRPLVDMTWNDDEADPSGAVKDEPTLGLQLLPGLWPLRPPQTPLVYFMFKFYRISFKTL
jgi:hypothetical protein